MKQPMYSPGLGATIPDIPSTAHSLPRASEGPDGINVGALGYANGTLAVVALKNLSVWVTSPTELLALPALLETLASKVLVGTFVVVKVNLVSSCSVHPTPIWPQHARAFKSDQAMRQFARSDEQSNSKRPLVEV